MMQQSCQLQQIGVFLDKFGDMYKSYIADGEKAEVIEFSFGFLVLKTEADFLYIETIYVAPEYRESGKGREMLAAVEQRAISENKLGILGSCSPGRKGSTISMKSMLACGFELHSCDKDIIYLIKRFQAKGV